MVLLNGSARNLVLFGANRWEAERATTADLQGRAAAAAAADLHDKVRSSTGALARAQTELESVKGELEGEQRRRGVAEREMDALRGQVWCRFCERR